MSSGDLRIIKLQEHIMSHVTSKQKCNTEAGDCYIIQVDKYSSY